MRKRRQLLLLYVHSGKEIKSCSKISEFDLLLFSKYALEFGNESCASLLKVVWLGWYYMDVSSPELHYPIPMRWVSEWESTLLFVWSGASVRMHRTELSLSLIYREHIFSRSRGYPDAIKADRQGIAHSLPRSSTFITQRSALFYFQFLRPGAH